MMPVKQPGRGVLCTDSYRFFRRGRPYFTGACGVRPLFKRYIRYRRHICLALLDVFIVAVALVLAVLLRYEGAVPGDLRADMLRFMPILLLLYGGVFGAFNLYSIMWRYAGGRQLLYQSAVIALAGLLSVALNNVLGWGLSRAVLVSACILAMGMIVSSRLMARSFRSRQSQKRHSVARLAPDISPLMIVGAGDAGNYVARQARTDNHGFGRPVAFVDDAPEKQGMSVQGITVRGKIEDIPKLVKQLDIRKIIIAMPSLKGERIEQVIALCNATKCRVRILSDPRRVEEEFHQKGTITMREPNIADFLSREEISLDIGSISGYLSGETVLVTGGGGSIGAEICRQVMKFDPAQLIIFDNYENCAYELLVELQQYYGLSCRVDVLVGSIRDRERLDEVMEAWRPRVVFHAAAHKHVPLMEKSPAEAIKNNVFGTLNLLESAASHGVVRFVQLSTDKAVNPTNIMGATKRVTEILIQQYARKTDMKCMAVRFGNVLGSHGSVIPLFERQIKNGGPVTLTHPEATRYFMTIPEAAQLVLQAGGMDDSGTIYILEMGEPVRIKDLADKLIRFYGFEPDVDMPIAITGMRPGEKLHEELLLDTELGQVTKTAHEKILAAPPLDIDDEAFANQLRLLRAAVLSDHGQILPILHGMVPSFQNGCEADHTEGKAPEGQKAMLP